MNPVPNGPERERWLAPRALLLGTGVAFLACCAAGRVVSRLDLYQDVHRFHGLLSPYALYYPTASEVCQLARRRLDPAKNPVVVGGSSILHGVWQGRDHFWTNRLQTLLGKRRQVLNLACIGARCAEFGGVAAEALAREYPRLILVIDVPPGDFWQCDPDGDVYKYFFWDAHSRGLLQIDPEREARLREVRAEREYVPGAAAGDTGSPRPPVKGEKQADLRTQMACDRLCYFNELWNAVTYHGVSTVWTPLTAAHFPAPRVRYADPDPGDVPVKFRYRPQNNPIRLEYLRALVHDRVQKAAGRWEENPASGSWAVFDRAARTCLPEEMRRRTLVVVPWESPYYRQQLTPDEQAAYPAVSRLTVRHLQALGFAAVEVGRGLTADDYLDHCHLLRAGGVKMAAAVASAVEQLTRRLGHGK